MTEFEFSYALLMIFINGGLGVMPVQIWYVVYDGLDTVLVWIRYVGYHGSVPHWYKYDMFFYDGLDTTLVRI